MPDNVTINLPIPTLSSAVHAFSFCAAVATVSDRPGLTTGSTRSPHSLEQSKFRPLIKPSITSNIRFISDMTHTHFNHNNQDTKHFKP